MNELLKPILILMAGILFFTLSSTAQVNFDKEWTLRKDMPVYSNPENKSVQANIYQNGDKVRLAFSITKDFDIEKAAYDIDSNVELEKNRLNSFLGLQAGLLLSDVELYKITKDKKYKEDAEIRVKNIIKLQIDGREGFFYYDRARKSEREADCRFQMLALYEYYKHFRKVN